MSSEMRMKKSIAFSLFLHILPIVLILTMKTNQKGDGEKDKNGQGSEQPIEIEVVELPKEDKDAVEKDKDEKGDLPEEKKKNENCKYYYGGIGVEVNYLSSKLTKVFKGYAAEKAGLEVGDLVESFTGEDIRGEVGTTISLRVTRGAEVLIVNVVREKICYEKTR